MAGEKERCILCGKVADILQECQVSERKYYVEGAGQLCGECYWKIYEPGHNKDIVRLWRIFEK